MADAAPLPILPESPCGCGTVAQPLRACERERYCWKEKFASSPQILRKRQKTVRVNSIYIRKPGPCSEPPRSGQEWENLLSRCLENRRDEMLGYFRSLLTGHLPKLEHEAEEDSLEEWITASFHRWCTLTDPLPADVGPRFPHGYYNIAYQILGSVNEITLTQLPDVIRASAVRYTGWPPFWYPTRREIEPYPVDGAVECWLGGDTKTSAKIRDVAHSDFWRISPDGRAYLLRGYQEDSGDLQWMSRGSMAPGTEFDVSLPIWRVGETLLQAERLATNLCEGPTTIRFATEFTGLKGRSLVSVNPRMNFRRGRKAHQDSIRLQTHVESQAIGPNLPEIVHELLNPLYALFGFFELPMQLVVDAMIRMRARKI